MSMNGLRLAPHVRCRGRVGCQCLDGQEREGTGEGRRARQDVPVRDAGLLSAGKLVPVWVAVFFFQWFTSCKSWDGKGRQSHGGCRPFLPYGWRMASAV